MKSLEDQLEKLICTAEKWTSLKGGQGGDSDKNKGEKSSHITCWKCGKTGHLKRQCTAEGKTSNQQEQQEGSVRKLTGSSTLTAESRPKVLKSQSTASCSYASTGNIAKGTVHFLDRSTAVSHDVDSMPDTFATPC